MLCEKCKKNEACYHSTLIVNGNSKSTHLCADCAKKEGVMKDNSNKFFKNFFKDFNDSFNFDFDKLDNLFCPTCNMNFGDFKANDFLGCPDCFDFFKEDFEDLKDDDKIEFSTPKKTKEEQELDRLKDQLKTAINEERYEDAADINKQIKNYKSKHNLN